MKNWKRYALAAIAVALVVVLAVLLWRMDTPMPQGPEPSPSTEATPSPTPATTPTIPPSPTVTSAVSPLPPKTAQPSPGAELSPSVAPTATPAPEPETRCTIAIRCDTVLEHLDELDSNKVELIPADGALLGETALDFSDGESAFDLLKRACQDNGIHLEFSITPGYGSAYIEGIGNLYEFDCGERSGWLYRVNAQVPSVACSSYTLQAGDAVEFLYSCDWGQDLD